MDFVVAITALSLFIISRPFYKKDSTRTVLVVTMVVHTADRVIDKIQVYRSLVTRTIVGMPVYPTGCKDTRQFEKHTHRCILPKSLQHSSFSPFS